MGQAGDPIEKVYVTIEADIANLLAGAKKGVDAVEKELRTVHKAVTASERKFKLLKKTISEMAAKSKVSFREAGAALKKAFDARGVKLELQEVNRAVKQLEKEGKKGFLGINVEALKFATILTTVQMGIQAVVRFVGNMARKAIQAFKSIGRQAIATNIQFENFVTQFTTLLGSAEAAQQRIQELTEFAVKTPFELPGIVEASRVLQVFGGDTLATGDNLTMVGDIAAGVGREFNEVALWVGRMYDAMQSGRPFGISASRLQVMGAMTGKARAELEKMQKEGATGAELWQRFNEIVGERWQGNMDRLSATLAGIISNLKDFATNILRIGGGPAFERLRESAGKLLQILEDNRPEIEAIAKAIGDVAANVVDFLATGLFEQLEDLDASQLLNIVDALWAATENARTFMEILLLLGDAANIKPILLLRRSFEGLAIVLGHATNNLAEFTAVATDDVDVLAKLDAVLAAHDARIRQHYQTVEESIPPIKKRTKALREEVDVLKEVADAEADIAMTLATEMIDARDKMNQQLTEATREHYERLGSIVRKSAERRFAIIQQYEQKRREVAERANEQLAELSAETARKRAEMEAEFRVNERRSQEDFQRDMARLQRRYVDSLADAVKNRDARAIVDLRRNFQREKKERTEDFQTKRQREQEDQRARLQELAANEARRRREIQQSLTKQLATMKAAHQQQLAELQRSQAQQIAAENSAYGRRRAELQRALADRLADMAKGLADEATLNAEGAQRILEVLNESFGIGGSIDKLMESFASRRRQKMVVSVALEPQATTSTAIRQQEHLEEQRRREEERRQWRERERRRREMEHQQFAGSFQHGGSVIARKPTIARFGEVPEMATFTPLSRISSFSRAESESTTNVNLNMSGSAPPGIRSGDRDQIAGVLLNALRESGGLRKR